MFEQMRQRLIQPGGRKEPVGIEPLQTRDLGSLHLGWNSHFSTAGLREHLEGMPGLSFKVRGQPDYIIGGLWRNRQDVGQIIESGTRYYREDLVAGLVEEYARRGFKAVVLGTDEHGENAQFYQQAGFKTLEQVVYYEKPDILSRYDYRSNPEQLAFFPFTPELQKTLVEVDNRAFPWLWWNSPQEFETYVNQEGVVIYLSYRLLENGNVQPVGYFGFTLYERWAHLDRLAVVPGLQGKRLGAYQLAYAIELMAGRGARRVTLSTQETNHQSQKLYEGFGFRRVRNLEYNLVGKLLEQASPDQ